jgi:FixJ family two-component response regulator
MIQYQIVSRRRTRQVSMDVIPAESSKTIASTTTISARLPEKARAHCLAEGFRSELYHQEA